MTAKSLYFSGLYTGNGGTGDDFSVGRPNDAWLLIVFREGRGVRKLAPDSFGAYIPKPYAFSGLVGYSVYKLF